MKSDEISIKKKIMFIKDEDYYFLTYHILIILDYFKCYGTDRLFTDYRKLPYLINFMSSEENTKMYKQAFESNSQTVIFDYENLLRVYTKSKFTHTQIKRLLFSLNQKGIIGITKDQRFGSISLFIADISRIKSLLDIELFEVEYNRINEIKNAYSRVRSIKYETFIDKVFKANGVGKWDD